MPCCYFNQQCVSLKTSLAISVVLHFVVLVAPWHGGGEFGERRLSSPALAVPAMIVTFRDRERARHLLVTKDEQAVPVEVDDGVGALFRPTGPTEQQPSSAAEPTRVQSMEIDHPRANQPRKGIGVLPADYRRPSELTEPPYPLTVGPLDFTDDEVGAAFGRYLVEIYIDETGRVDDVDVVTVAAPPKLRERARIVFGETRYHPGIWRGKAVKSRLRVELHLPPKRPQPGG